MRRPNVVLSSDLLGKLRMLAVMIAVKNQAVVRTINSRPAGMVTTSTPLSSNEVRPRGEPDMGPKGRLMRMSGICGQLPWTLNTWSMPLLSSYSWTKPSRSYSRRTLLPRSMASRKGLASRWASMT